jgi:hypothetical protein
MIKAQGIKNKLNMFSVGDLGKIREWGTKQSQGKSPLSFLPPPYNLGAPQVESQNWNVNSHHESLETQPKPPLSPQIIQQVLASLFGHGQSFPGLRRKLQ